MEVKAIVSDVDGTLLTSEGIVSPKTVQMIRQARKNGLLFGLSTGRDVNSVMNLLPEWGIDGLVDIIVGSGGAEIYDLVLEKYEESFPLDGNLIKEIMEHYQDMDVNFTIPWHGILYSPKDDYHIRNLSKADKIPYQIVDFDDFLKEPKPKLIIVCHPRDMNAVVERSQTFKNDQYKAAALITASSLFEYMDPHISKTYGLKQVLEPHSIDLKDVCAFGDADNDYDMILNAGMGVAMANGSEKTRNAADYLTDDHDHDGIAHFISRYILKEENSNE